MAGSATAASATRAAPLTWFAGAHHLLPKGEGVYLGRAQALCDADAAPEGRRRKAFPSPLVGEGQSVSEGERGLARSRMVIQTLLFIGENFTLLPQPELHNRRVQGRPTAETLVSAAIAGTMTRTRPASDARPIRRDRWVSASEPLPNGTVACRNQPPFDRTSPSAEPCETKHRT